jgi:hypothetical protein
MPDEDKNVLGTEAKRKQLISYEIFSSRASISDEQECRNTIINPAEIHI